MPPSRPFKARYDLYTKLGIASFDFFFWMAHVIQLGATEIVFTIDRFRRAKWPEEVAKARYESIVRPGPALAGLPYQESNSGVICGSHLICDLAPLMQNFRRFKSVLPPARAKYTVTLRQFEKNPERNSDVDLWRAFAERIGAHVIEDHAVQPIELYDRVALYAGARMNFGVTNGPMALNFLTPYPVMMFDCGASQKGFGGHGLRPGDQIPWALPNQRMIWEKPDLDMLMRAWDSVEREVA